MEDLKEEEEAIQCGADLGVLKQAQVTTRPCANFQLADRTEREAMEFSAL